MALAFNILTCFILMPRTSRMKLCKNTGDVGYILSVGSLPDSNNMFPRDPGGRGAGGETKTLSDPLLYVGGST